MSCPCDEEDALVHSLVGRDKEESMSLLVATLLGPVPGRKAVPGAAQRGLVQWDRHRLQYCAVLQGNGLFKYYNTSSSVNPIGSRLSIHLLRAVSYKGPCLGRLGNCVIRWVRAETTIGFLHHHFMDKLDRGTELVSLYELNNLD